MHNGNLDNALTYMKDVMAASEKVEGQQICTVL